VSELLAYAQGSPFLLLVLVVLGALLYAAERVFALSGPITKLVCWWQGRALAKLRREAELRAEQRRIQREEETAVMADLRGQLADLSAEVARLRSVVRASEAHHRVMRDWADGLLRSARSAGLTYVDPPATDEQPAVTAG
jgi:hypothetical protein